MAALCPGVQYGLSSQENFCENKDLIFVKLTDSALRAIEEYIKNQNKFNYKSPTIKFLGNDGQLSLPSVHNGGVTSFKFSMSTTADMEGPGGSFECVRQTAPPRGSLSALGSIPHKIRILANEDVYEATRQRMTVAEENHKNKCTREIKPNQTDIGRKVKVKQSRNAPPPPHQVRKDNFPLRETLSKPSYQLNNVPSKPLVHHNSNGLSNGLGNNHVSSSRPQQNKPSVPDIARRPLKERLIHLLALRPFKKVELYERLTKEGLREKNGMSSVLKQISKMKDNCYHLNRAMWNDVHDDWPFYTEFERMILKRRKPQNLTPPGSSDGGSSGSGQSPMSTHPGSPPPPITSSKRPGYYDGADGLPTKRQRISHYRKPSEQAYRTPVENISQRRPVTDSRDTSNMNPRSRESPVRSHYPPPSAGLTNGYAAATTNNTTSSSANNSAMLNDRRNLSDDEDNNANRNFSCDSHSLGFGVKREKTIAHNNNNNSGSNNSRSSPAKPMVTDDVVVRKEAVTFGDRGEARNGGLTNGYANGRTVSQDVVNKDKDRNRYNGSLSSNSGVSLATSQNSRIYRTSPDSSTVELPFVDSGPPPVPPPPAKAEPEKEQLPDFLTEYPPIESAEQRRKYKSLFNADYAEYKELHRIVEKVSRRFAELEENLKKENSKSPKYKDMKKLIVKEYQENKKDLEHQKAKARFQYLHEKLSHIKRLVSEYDQRMVKNQY